MRIAHNHYSAPERHIGRKIHARVGERMVEFFLDKGGERIAVHRLKSGRNQYASRRRPGMFPSPSSMAPTMSILPSWLRTARTTHLMAGRTSWRPGAGRTCRRSCRRCRECWPDSSILPRSGCRSRDRSRHFSGAGVGAAHTRIGKTTMTFPATTTTVPGESRTGLAWMATAGGLGGAERARQPRSGLALFGPGRSPHGAGTGPGGLAGREPGAGSRCCSISGRRRRV